MKKTCFIVVIILLSSLVTCTSKQEQPRVKKSFDNDWRFMLGDDQQAKNPGYDDSDWRMIDIPHDWSVELPVKEDNAAGKPGGFFEGGIGWYRKSFSISSEDIGKRIFILFDGIYHNSDVWLNGKHLGHKNYGYIGFFYDITTFLNYDTTNVLAVRVDHKNQPTDRWYSGSGIYRHVWFIKTNNLHIPVWGTNITTTDVSLANATIDIETEIVNTTDDDKACHVKTEIRDAGGNILNIIEEDAKIPALGKTIIEQQVAMLDPTLWSCDLPYLYKAVTFITENDNIVDRYETKFGVRDVEFDPEKGFFLNGENIILKGVNIHHAKGCLGAAVNDRVMVRRLKLLKDMGCNTVRLAHNPHEPQVLDICDSIGLMVFNEMYDKWAIPWQYAWGDNPDFEYTLKEMKQQFYDTWEQDMTDFIDRDKNHPSNIIWSIGNETIEQLKAPEEGVELARKMKALVHGLDPSRMVTAAMHPGNKDKHEVPSGIIHELDVVSYNYRTHNFDEWHEKYPDMIFISTETQPYTNGEPPTFDTVDFSNNSWFDVKDFVAGQYIWTGIDYLGESMYWPNKGFCFGLMDVCGFMKPHAFFVKSMYDENPMVHVSVFDDTLAKRLKDIESWQNKWAEPPVCSHWNFAAEDQSKDIYVFSNCEKVELMVNDKSYGERLPIDYKDHVVRWTVPYKKGKIEAIGKNNGEEVCRHDLITAGKPAKINLIADRTSINADGKDVTHIEIQVTDKNDVVCPHAELAVTAEINGAGEMLAMDNGDMADHTLYTNPKREVRKGKALLLVQSHTSPGTIKIQVTADGLEPDSVSVAVVE